jgi:hypothetical protein
MNYLAILDKALGEIQGEDKSGHSWQGFYPGLAPSDFAIVETAGGISGRKVKGEMSGLVSFFIPFGKHEKGPQPTTKREMATATSQEWDFSKIYIPSQTDPARIDVWMVGERVNGDKSKWWFLGTEESRNETDEGES